MNLVLYARTSGSGSGEESLDAQCERSEAWAHRQDHEVVGRHRDESVAGTLPVQERPGLRAAVSAVKDGCAAGLLVPGLDRLAREAWQQEAALLAVWQHGGVVLEAGHGEVPRDDPDDPTRKLLRLIMGAVWGFDRDVQVKRMRQGRERKASRGGYIGGYVPYGYRVVDKEFVEVAAEQAAIARMTALCSYMSYEAVAGRLTAEGFAAPAGGAWHKTTVRQITNRQRAGAA